MVDWVSLTRDIGKLCFIILGFLVILISAFYASFVTAESNQLEYMRIIDEYTIKCLSNKSPINDTYCGFIEKYEKGLNITSSNIGVFLNSLDI